MKIKLDDLIYFQSGIYVKTNPEGDLIYLQVSDFDSNRNYRNTATPSLLTDAKMSRHLLQQEDILFAAKGSNNFATVYKKEFGLAIASSAFIVLRIKDENRSKVNPAFLAWQLNHPAVLESLKRNAVGSSMLSITMQQLSALTINLPPMQKQEVIVELDRLHKRETDLQKQLSELKATLLQHQLLNAII